MLCNIRDLDSVRLAMQDADAVINCVNLTGKEGKSTFENVLVEGAGNIAQASKDIGVPQIVHISGIGVDPESDSKYVAAKSRGEALVTEHRPDAVILRPSVIFGVEDQLYNRFASMARLGPLMPIPAAKTKMQPVFVEDVARAAADALEGKTASGIYELGGPEVMTLREIVNQTLKASDRRRLVLGMPFWMAGIGAGLMDFVQMITGGLVKNNIATRDQLHLLRMDNVVSPDAKGFADLGIEPTAPEAVINTYLWRFRPSGQYEEIKASAQNMRKP